jgi:hypothetical protein
MRKVQPSRTRVKRRVERRENWKEEESQRTDRY